MKLNDVAQRADIELIINDFYTEILADPIIGFIFTDIAKINLDIHLPLIVDFWSDVIFRNSQLINKTKSVRLYKGNVLQAHLQLNSLISLKPGHFTRWLYLFNKSVDDAFAGKNCDALKKRAESIAETISAAITEQKKTDMKLVLPRT